MDSGRILERAAAVVAVVGVLAGSACALLPTRPRGAWLHATTAHFEIASGLSARRTREIARELERFRVLALEFGALEDRETGVPTWVVLFPRTRNYAALRLRRDVTAFFQPSAHKNFVVLDASESEESIGIARHELVHLLFASGTTKGPPAWLQEGFADLLSTAREVGDEIEIGAPPEGRVDWLARATPLPLAQVLSARDVLRWDRRALRSFYVQSWALAHYLRVGGEAAPAPGALDRYRALIAAGSEADAACREAFGRDLETLERDLLRFAARAEFGRVRVPAREAAAAQAVSLAPLAGAERDALLGELALALGERRFPRAERWLRAALAAEPAHPRAGAALAWLLAQRGALEARAVLERAEPLARGDAEAEARVAEAWLALASRAAGEEQRALLARAQAAYERSLALDPARAAARFGVAQIALALGEAERAARALESVRGALPALPAVDVALAESQLASGRPELARAPLLRALENSHSPAAATNVRGAQFERLLAQAGLASQGPLATRHLAARLDVHEPAPGARATTDLPWFEVRGNAGLWEAALQDIVIALDVSNSTLDASGLDVDRDGRVGRTRRVRQQPLMASSDRGDSIVRAELLAAERLLAELDPDTTRVALVRFTATASVAAPLGPPQQTLAALRRHRVAYDGSGTSFKAALASAFEELIAHRYPDRRTQRTILMLSDGEPTAPNRPAARSEALASARELARYGVRVHAFALGKEASEKSETLRAVAKLTGGGFSIANGIGDVSFLRDVRLTGLEDVSIRNLRGDHPARAVRVFADGSFDGFVPLEAGENAIEIRARVAGREPLVARRSVLFTPPTLGDSMRADATRAAETRAERAAELLRVLRERTAEIAQRAGMQKERAARERRTLRLELAEPDVGAAGPAE